MADLIREYTTARTETKDMGQMVSDLTTVASDSRKTFVRRWYDNNFFDDGYHFRYLSRTENKIVDLSERSTMYTPMRAIPKASRQIRGVANLLIERDPTPIVYPEKVNFAAYPPIKTQDPETGQMVEMPNPEMQEALKEAKRIAKLTGHWITEEFKSQVILEKLAQMIVLTAKHGVSYMQIWPDYVDEAIRSQVYDAFDIYLIGSLTSIYDSPFIIKGTPMLISQIKANEYYDLEQRMNLNPDNKQASDEIKDAYMRARYGREGMNDAAATVLLKEAYLKEYINEYNMPRIRAQENGEQIMKNKKTGDPVIRQVCVAGNIWLRDEYVNLPEYPFVDFRMEPGPIYQVPLIERFIPANKSLDMLVSRAERYSHTMVTGSWSKKQGEQFEINNSAGGQILEYQTTPPIQNNIASIPTFYFQLMNMMTSLIEEQGVTTTTLGKLPSGVKANAAIESLKESEYSSLVIAARQLKGTMKRMAEKFLDIADNQFVTPKTVYYLEKGEPQYFDVIGNRAYEERQKLKVDEEPLNAVPLKKEYRVEIEIEAGMGYTREGRKAAAKELADFMVQLAGIGLLDPQTVMVFIEGMLESYEFGRTQDIMEAMKQGGLGDATIDKMKIAIAEVMKDMQEAQVLPTSEQRIEEGKVATAEVIKDVQGGGQNA